MRATAGASSLPRSSQPERNKVGEQVVCRRHGISEQTFYRWKAKYAALEVNEVRRLRTLEYENGRLKRLVADLTPG